MAESRTASNTALTLELIERIHDVAEEMESVSNLNGTGGAESNSISNAESTVARDDLGTGMRSQPTRQRGRFIVRQHVKRSAYRQVHQ